MGRYRSKSGCFVSEKVSQKRRKVALVKSKSGPSVVHDHVYDPGQDHSNYSLPYRGVKNETVIDHSQLNHGVWEEGRRIVDLDYLASQLASCQACSQALHLTQCIGEKIYGLASQLSIMCSNVQCGAVNKVCTSRQHWGCGQDRGIGSWDINTKLSLGLIDSGIGYSQVTKLLSTMNIPSPTWKSMKKHESQVEEKLDKVAQEACHSALEQECTTSEGEGLGVSYDAGWQRRSTGRAYNSLSGHSALIGVRTGKVLKYAVRSKTCKTCETAKSKSRPPPVHKCFRNWQGSAKAMEPDMAVDMISSLKQSGIRVGKLVMDDDTTTLSRVHREVDATLVKSSDKNHVTKTFMNSLYDLEKKHKSLTYNIKKYFRRMFSLALCQCQDNPGQMKSRLEAIVTHAFGNHNNCESSWCGAVLLPDPTTYMYKGLPRHHALQSPDLQKDLSDLFLKYTKQCDKLCDLSSSQANESLNSSIARKAPKGQHYSSTGALYSRVSAAVAEKNEGSSYVMKVNEALCLSPGGFTKAATAKLDRARCRRRLWAQSVAHKRRRKQLKELRITKTSSLETREGPTYATGVGLTSDADITQIPPAELAPVATQVDPVNHNYSVVYFDLETTGLGSMAGITQIAASGPAGTLNKYVLPQKPISKEASEATLLTYKNGLLYHKDQPVPAVSPFEALTSFIDFMDSMKPCLLVAHNCKAFDSKVLTTQMKEYNLTSAFKNVCCGFSDTLLVCRSLFPDRSRQKLSFKQVVLCKDLLNYEYEAHDAEADVTALDRLSELWEARNLLDVSFTVDYVSALMSFTKKKQCLVKDFKTVVENKVASKCTVSKIAGSGLSLAHLKLAYKRDEINGIGNVLSEKVNGKPRVTSSKLIIQKLTDYMSTICK